MKTLLVLIVAALSYAPPIGPPTYESCFAEYWSRLTQIGTMQGHGLITHAEAYRRRLQAAADYAACKREADAAWWRERMEEAWWNTH